MVSSFINEKCFKYLYAMKNQKARNYDFKYEAQC